MLSHLAVGRVIEPVISMAGAQQIEEVQPALRCAGGEPGEPVIADLGAEAILARVARTGVVDRYKGRRLQPGAQNVLGFADEILLLSVSRRCNWRFAIATPNACNKAA